jgi:hypothetical protein
MALAGLVLCLLRPDGLLFAMPLYFAAMVHNQDRLRKLTHFTTYFLLPGLGYFLWRFHYFGEVWPLPFIVKSHAVRWKGLFVIESVKDISRYFCPAVALIAQVCGKRAWRGINRDIILCSILIPSLFYCRMRLDQNLADRFFFYLMLVPAFLFCLNRTLVLTKAEVLRIIFPAVWTLAWAWAYVFALFHLGYDRYQTDELVARDIQRSHIQGTMAITEAGWLAYSTGWKAIDLWGLNSPQFAHRVLQPEDVKRIDPDLLVVRFSTCTIDPKWPLPSTERTWANMAENALRGASSAGQFIEIVLPYSQSGFASKVERFTDGTQTYLCYFVNQRSAKREALMGILRNYEISANQSTQSTPTFVGDGTWNENP